MSSASKKKQFCFICGMFDEKENGKIALLSVPKGKVDEWQKLIPKSGLHASSRICSKHFEIADIVTGKYIQNTFYPHKNWTLLKGAIPKHLCGDNSYRQISSQLKEKSYNCLNIENGNVGQQQPRFKSNFPRKGSFHLPKTNLRSLIQENGDVTGTDNQSHPIHVDGNGHQSHCDTVTELSSGNVTIDSSQEMLKVGIPFQPEVEAPMDILDHQNCLVEKYTSAVIDMTAMTAKPTHAFDGVSNDNSIMSSLISSEDVEEDFFLNVKSIITLPSKYGCGMSKIVLAQALFTMLRAVF